MVVRDLQSEVRAQLDGVQSQLDLSVRLLKTWSGLSIMSGALDEDAFSLQRGAAEVELLRLRTDFPLFADLQTISRQGLVTSSTSSTLRFRSVADSTLFRSALAGSVVQQEINSPTGTSLYTLAVAVPIYDSVTNREIVGVLQGLLDWKAFQTMLARHKVMGDSQGKERRVVLQRQSDGRVLYSTWGHDLATHQTQAELANLSIRKVSQGDGEFLVGKAVSRDGVVHSDPGWVMQVALDKNTALASILEYRGRMILLGVVALSVIAAMGFMLSRSIVKPINELVAGVQQVASGNYDLQLPEYRSTNEIGKLSSSFEIMRQSIRATKLDLTERTHQAEQAARLKGEFLANMSHEVRTPINGVLGMAELLLKTDLSRKQEQYASTIFRSGNSLLGVINDILDFSKIEAGKLELQDHPFDLRVLVDDVVELLAESAQKKGIELTARLDSTHHLAFRGDGNRLRQVLINLLGNAIKFTAEGEVRLNVFEVPDHEGKAVLTFEVSDTGIGISEEERGRIFESFVQADGSTTRRFGGTGLGLSISSSLVELMGGELDVRSVPGEGSTFFFTSQLEKLTVSSEQNAIMAESLRDKRVLVVDDNKTNREILQEQLQHWGVETTLVDGGAPALDAMHRSLDSGMPFDLVLLDMHMPEMDGLEVAKRITADPVLCHTPLILLSSVLDHCDISDQARLGIRSSLTKPVRQSELLYCLNGALSDQQVDTTPPNSRSDVAFEPLTGHVLVAEDNLINQELMHEMLDLMGVTHELAEHGEEAVERFTKGGFDMILMDCQMPILDGFEATATIRQMEIESPDSTRIPIVALTANALEGDREKCLASGMDEYLSKPLAAQDLHAVLKAWLPASSRQDQAA